MTTKTDNLPERLLRRPEVITMTSLASSTLTYLIAKGDFPKPYKLSGKLSAWKLSEVQAWINSRNHKIPA